MNNFYVCLKVKYAQQQQSTDLMNNKYYNYTQGIANCNLWKHSGKGRWADSDTNWIGFQFQKLTLTHTKKNSFKSVIWRKVKISIEMATLKFFILLGDDTQPQTRDQRRW